MGKFMQDTTRIDSLHNIRPLAVGRCPMQPINFLIKQADRPPLRLNRWSSDAAVSLVSASCEQCVAHQAATAAMDAVKLNSPERSSRSEALRSVMAGSAPPIAPTNVPNESAEIADWTL
jgi:hypothetical protein